MDAGETSIDPVDTELPKLVLPTCKLGPMTVAKGDLTKTPHHLTGELLCTAVSTDMDDDDEGELIRGTAHLGPTEAAALDAGLSGSMLGSLCGRNGRVGQDGFPDCPLKTAGRGQSPVTGLRPGAGGPGCHHGLIQSCPCNHPVVSPLSSRRQRLCLEPWQECVNCRTGGMGVSVGTSVLQATENSTQTGIGTKVASGPHPGPVSALSPAFS